MSEPTLDDAGSRFLVVGHTRDHRKGKDIEYHEKAEVGSLKQPSGNQQDFVVFDDFNAKVTDDVGSVRSTFNNEAPRNGVKIVELHNTSMNGPMVGGDESRALRNQVLGVQLGGRIRHLTPVECERLQGFPDNWTAGVSDTQRYKMMGNAVTVNVIEAIGRKILETW